EVARVIATGRRAPSDVDWATYQAIPSRHSHRGPFRDEPVPEPLRQELIAAGGDGVQLRAISGLEESTVIANLLSHAGLVLRHDRGYQRELAMWINDRPDHHPGGGIPALAVAAPTLPWAGLVRPTTTVPDANVLAARLERDFLLLVETPDDGHRDHLLAGQALEHAWPTACRYDLAGSVLTQPVH